MSKRILLVLITLLITGAALWAGIRFTAAKRNRLGEPISSVSNRASSLNAEAWAEAVAKVKADRPPTESTVGIVIPSELKHYSDRHWFLATQVAEIAKYEVRTCQDYVDLAAMIERGEMVPVASVTNTYVLFGVGARANNDLFTRYADNKSVELLNEAQLSDAYKRVNDKRSQLQSEIASLRNQSNKLKKDERSKQSEIQKQISVREQELKSAEEDLALLDQFYGQPDNRQKLLHDYESLRNLATNFNGRSFNIDDPADRLALKVNMLSSLRPVALKILEEVASVYHTRFDRPLPVSSLVRPEQYQHVLSRVNRNAVLIDTPPHSTGLAFDIDYRYMSPAEQSFLMDQLARMKREGRIEVLRERNSNYHVFAFVEGRRPGDDLITASLDKATTDVPEANHETGTPAKVKSKPQKGKSRITKAKSRKGRH